jgi:hypothetical protein
MTANSSLTADTYISPAMRRGRDRPEPQLSLGLELISAERYVPYYRQRWTGVMSGARWIPTHGEGSRTQGRPTECRWR